MYYVFTLLFFNKGSKDSTGTEDEESTSEEDGETIEQDTSVENPAEVSSEGSERAVAASSVETEAGAEISALVNYVQPVHFSSFENAKSLFS